jgi:hypothetical protein
MDAGTTDGDGNPAAADGGRDPVGPRVLSLAPATGARGREVTLGIEGSGFAAGAVVVFDGQELPASRASEVALSVVLPAALLADAGFHSVEVAPARGGPRSNRAYFNVAAPAGWPEVLDFNPDSGVAGDKIRVVGFNLSAEALQITDGAGHAAQTGRIGTQAGNGALLETAELTIPAGWQSGPMLVKGAAGTFRGKVFTVGKNLVLLPGTKVTASSEYGGEWTVLRGADNDIFSSWFTAAGDCVGNGGCTMTPWFLVTFAAPQTVARIALRGNREYTTGYDFLRARFELLGEGDAVLSTTTHQLLEPDRDVDVTWAAPVAGVKAVRFRSEADESEDPGFGELAVFGP